MTNRDREPFVPTEEAASFLGKERGWLYDNLDRLDIPHVRIGRQLRFRISDLDSWAQQQSEGTHR